MSDKRLRVAVRDQLVITPSPLDPLLPPEHPVRQVGDFVGSIDQLSHIRVN